MPKLEIRADDGKTLIVDVTGHNPSDYDDLAIAANADYMGKRGPLSIAEQNLQELNNQGPIDELKRLSKETGTDIKAGLSGLADIANPTQAAQNVSNVESGKPPTTPEGAWGEKIGSYVQPIDIATQAAIGPILAASGIGEWALNIIKGWGEEAALGAVGKIKALAKALGLVDVDSLGEFLLKPVAVGEKTFEPIVQAFRSPKDMLEAARGIQMAAGKQLGSVAQNVDEAISKDVSVLDWKGLLDKIVSLKEEAVGDISRLGKAVGGQYDDALGDLEDFVTKQLNGPTDNAFSKLSTIKTKIGGLVFKHGTALESKAALNDVYSAINSVLKDAAEKTGGESTTAWLQANDIYHKISSVVEGLEGKVVDAKNWFGSMPAIGALTGATGMITHSPVAALAVPASYLGTKLASTYAPQVIASGLDVAAPNVAPAITRTLPFVGRTISNALNDND